MCRRIEPYTEPESVPREFRARRRGAPRPTPRGGPYRHKRPRAGRGAYRGQEFDNSMSYRFALSRRLIVITDLPKHSAATSGVAQLSASRIASRSSGPTQLRRKIGRESGRERGCQYGYISVVAVALKK